MEGGGGASIFAPTTPLPSEVRWRASGPELSCRAPAWRGVGWGPFRSRGCKYCTYNDDMAIASWPTSRKLFTNPSILNLDTGLI